MRTEIDAVNRQFEAAMRDGNADGLAAVYTANGNAMPPNGPMVSGTADLRAFWQGVIDMGIAGVQLRTVELDDLGETVNELGEFVLKTADGAVADSGKFIVVWKQENGAWKWHHDIWNSSNPAGQTLGGVDEFRQLIDVTARGLISPLIDACYALDDIKAGFVRMKQGEQMGKLVLEIGG